MVRAILGDRAVIAHDELRRLSPLAQLFVIATTLAGGGLILLYLVTIRFNQPVLFVELLVLAVVTSIVKISVPLARSRSSLSLSFAVTLAAIPVLGGQEACLVGIGSAWTQCSLRMKARNPLYRTLFSVVVVGLSVRVAALAFEWGRAGDAHDVMSVLQPIGLATTGYLVVNSLLVAVAIGLAANERILKGWLDTLFWSAPTYFVAGMAAALAVIARDTGTYGWYLGMLIPLALTYRSSRRFVDQLQEEQAQVRRTSEVQLATIEALATAVETKDRTSQNHIRQIQHYAEALARAINMPEPEITGVRTASLLHDIGHLAVPEHILVKPGALTQEEFQRVKIHPRVGADILRSVRFPYPVASLILSHHERWDGTGYPSGLAGEDIPLGARVLAVVDYFTALRADRPYRPARSSSEAVALLRQEAGAALDPTLVAEFLAILPRLEGEMPSGCDDAARTSDALATTGGGALEQIRTAHHEARVLHEIAESLVTTLTVDNAMAVLASKLPELLPFSGGALFLWDTEANCFRCRWAVGVGEQWVRQLTSSDPKALLAQFPPRDADVPLRSALSSPLMSGGQVIGVFLVYTITAAAYAGDHRRLLDRVCQQAASITANALIFEEMHEASLTDPITGLANRRALYQHLRRNLPSAEHDQARVSVLLLDMNELKHLNDSYGHHVGDRALQRVGTTLASLQRTTDLCVRYGGDEFVVVLWGCGAPQAEERRRQLQRAVADLRFFVPSGNPVELSVSAGAATFPDDGTTADALLAVADQRMYVDKALRRSSAGETAARAGASLRVAI